MNYWESSRSPLYSLLFTAPLFIIYEIGIFLCSKSDLVLMRNGADALMRQILENFGIFGLHGIGVVFLIGSMIVIIVQKKYWRSIKIIGDHLLLMMFESLFWGIALYYFMANINVYLMNPNGNAIIQQVTLAIGAGIYEELFFRVLLFSCLNKILGFVFQWSSHLKQFTSLLLAAGIFSAFHFIGEYGDYFYFDLFLIRFFAGVILGLMYLYRGFGVAAWSHSIYDLIILTQTTKNI
tara:strand:+ start:534 stop:1244 length:711 start_codon:yes stop_codon:yes gene_type:complete